MIFVALILLIIAYWPDIRHRAEGASTVVVGAPHTNGPMVVAPATPASEAPTIDTNGITEWLKDHTPKK